MLPWYAGLLFVASETYVQPDQAGEPPKSLVVGRSVNYSGRLVPVAAGSDDRSARTFRISYLVAESPPASGYRVAWLLEELSGEPRRSWAHRFGMLSVTAALAVAERELPAIR